MTKLTFKLFCFDIDGTLDTEEMAKRGELHGGYVMGGISEYILKEIESHGSHVAIVSPSPFAPKGFKVIADFGSNDYRWRNVFDAMKHFRITKIDDVVYIDDLSANRIQLQSYAIRVYSPSSFMTLYDVGFFRK